MNAHKSLVVSRFPVGAFVFAIATITVSAATNFVNFESAPVHPLALGPDGRTLAAGYSDGLAQIWDIASGTLAARVTEHQNFVGGLTFSPDGNSLATWRCAGSS